MVLDNRTDGKPIVFCYLFIYLFIWRPLVFAPILLFENNDLKKKIFSQSSKLHSGWQELNASVVKRISFLVGLVFDSRLIVLSIEKKNVWLLFGCLGEIFLLNGKQGQILFKKDVWYPYY